MTLSASPKTAFWFSFVLASALAAEGAEIRLKPELHCRDRVVRLGDVAEIQPTDGQSAAALAAIELFPAPAARRTRILRAGELRELLTLHGLDSAGLTISGEATTIVRSDSPSASQELPSVELQKASQRAQRAILGYLETVAGKAAWDVKVELDPASVRLLTARLSTGAVEGGRAPWVGEQEFVIVAPTDRGAERARVRARVSLPDAIVVAARALKSGEVIREGNVRLAPSADPGRGFEPIRRLEDAVGKAAARAIPDGQPIDSRELQSPRLVRRRERVTVIARESGVRVRTSVVALADGGLGDLVEVESDFGRQRFNARVVGFQEVEVYARGPSVERTSTDGQ